MRHATTGRRSRSAGAGMEAEMSAMCAHYRAEGFALIQKVPTPIKRVGLSRFNRGPFQAVYEAKSSVDFVGTLEGGRSVAVEAKSALTPTRMPLKVRSHPVIRPHQTQYLDAACQLGALAGVVIRLGPSHGATWYALTWPGWWDAVAATAPRLSISAQLLAEYGEVINPPGRIDWLRALVRADEREQQPREGTG